MENSTPDITVRRGAVLPPPFTPYDYQVPIIKKMIGAINEGRNGLIIQPTATGKSVEAAFVARACALLHGKRGLYLYDENEGLNQARLKFEEIFNKNPIVCANFFGYGKDELVETADMVFASFQSLNNHHQKSYLRFNVKHFDYIIVNEGHHAQAITYKEVLDYFLCPKIGMTATPIRMDGKDILEIFHEILFEMQLEEAIAKGRVAQIEYHMLSHNLSTQKLKKICKDVLEEGKRISIKQLNESIFIEMLDEEMLNEVYKHSFPVNGKPRQTLIFCENILHAEHVLGLLQKNGRSVEVVHSRRSKGHNRDSMKHFRLGRIQFLISVDKLNEDIDVPNVEVGVFLRATDSLTVFLQQLGRLLRKTTTKNKAIVLDFVSNCERLAMIQEIVGKVLDFVENIGGLPIEKNPLHVAGEGFDFKYTNDIIDVLKLIKGIRDGRYSTWQEASASAQEIGFKSLHQYRKKYVKDARLPADPKSYYKDFPGWDIFLGKTNDRGEWRTASDLAKENNMMTLRIILKYANQFRDSNSGWYKMLWHTNGKLREHYNPELVQKIRIELKNEIIAPKGWCTANSLVTKGISVTGIKKMAYSYRGDHPEWIKKYRTITNSAEHYHPDLVLKIKERITNLKNLVPKGWITIGELAIEIHMYYRNLKTLIKEHTLKNPEWLVSFSNGRGVITEYCHPDLIVFIKKGWSRMPAPEGWESAVSVTSFGFRNAKKTIENFVERFRSENSEWFKNYLKGGRIIECYHPQLVEKIKAKFSTDNTSRDGWQRIRDFKGQFNSLKRRSLEVKEYIKPFRTSNPEWFELYYPKKFPIEYLHPDLIQKIIDYFTKK